MPGAVDSRSHDQREWKMRDLFRYVAGRKKYWLLPVIFVLLIMGGLLVLAQGSVLAPFIYTLF